MEKSSLKQNENNQINKLNENVLLTTRIVTIVSHTKQIAVHTNITVWLEIEKKIKPFAVINCFL